MVTEKRHKKDFHLHDIEDVLNAFNTSRDGLDQEDASKRLEQTGPNVIKQAKKRSLFMMFLDQFKDPLVILLLIAAVVSQAIGEASDTIVILVIVVLNSLIGFVQEYRAEKAIDALKAMSSPHALVRRNGRILNIRTEEIVLGDIVLLEAGMIVPADMRLIETAALKIDESALTGESSAVEKVSSRLSRTDVQLSEMSNMAFKGTIVTYGRAEGVCVATGMDTEVGHIAKLIEGADELKTPLQQRLARVGKNLAITAVVICSIVFVAGLMRGADIMEMFLTAVSLAVAAVPEALPAVVTISLALGAKEMVRQNALIRRLPAVETLGSVTFICTDKTGTLTMNQMKVTDILNHELRSMDVSPEPAVLSDNPDLDSMLLAAMAISNDVEFKEDGTPVGDPTELALWEASRDRGYVKNRLIKDLPRVFEIPFSSETQSMTTVHRLKDGRFIAFSKGGFEAIASRCVDFDIDRAREVHIKLAEQGKRVLAFAMKYLDSPDDSGAEKDMTFLGLVAELDPPRPEARDAVETCRRAGITPVMITGDHPVTASAIARAIGIVKDVREDVLTGQDLKGMSLEQLKSVVSRVRCYARVIPEQKLKLVAALQARGEAVAMTGDGVNDAPALKQAEIGIAMGKTGTDVAKEASDMILLDDNFATIVSAIREGRKIFDNIRKFFKYTLTSNSGEIWTIFLAPFLGLPIPLLPIHILWINLATDGLPGLALTVEPEEPDIMSRPPRRPEEGLFSGGMWQHMLVVGLIMGGVCLLTQWGAIKAGSHWQTMVFTVLCFSQFGHCFAISSDRVSIFKRGFYSNPALFWVIIGSILAQLVIIYVPFFQKFFHTQALSLKELAVTFILSTVVFWVVEIEKVLRGRAAKRAPEA